MRIALALSMALAPLVVQNDDPYLGAPPKEVAAKETEAGIELSSADPKAPFSLEFAGKEIEPLSSERLKLRIDGTEVEVVVARRNWMLRSDTPDVEVLGDYRDRVEEDAATESVEFAFDSGDKALLWTRRFESGESRLVAATTIGDRIVALVSAEVPAKSVAQVRAYLRNSLLTLNRGKVTVPTEAGQSPSDAGATLGGIIRLFEALTGSPHAAFINPKLTPPKDREAGFVLPLDSGTLIEMARFLNGSGEAVLAASVFDGDVAHSINITAFDSESKEVHYWDPWGEGSFLQEGNNKANVKAKQNALDPRTWQVTEAEMERVLCWIVLEADTLLGGLRTCAILHRPPESAVVAYRNLRRNDPEGKSADPAWLAQIAGYLLDREKPQQALTLYAASWLIAPPVPLEREEAIAALRAAGIEDPAAELGRLTQQSEVPVLARPRRTFADVEETDFYTFFNLEEVTKGEREDGGSFATYRSRGQFRPDLAVTLDFSADGSIVRYEADIARTFIDSDEVGMFARDVAKSFIAFAVADADRNATGPLVEEIYMPEPYEVPVPGARRPTAVPGLLSLGAMTYVGAHAAFEQTLRCSVLRMENLGPPESRSLRIQVLPR